MGFASRLVQLYFNFVYNAVYDSTTAQVPSYRRLQELCLDRFHFQPGDRLLCVGVGTGNEILRILDRDGQVDIVGTDISPKALQKASRKVSQIGRSVKLLRMNACKLEFEGESFDKVFCFHVMDFVEDAPRATREIIRVLRKGGQFVLTYPSAREGLRMGAGLLKENLRHSPRTLGTRLKLLLSFGAGIIYVPLLFRGNRRSYSPSELESILRQSGVSGFAIDGDALYRNLIACGHK